MIETMCHNSRFNNESYSVVSQHRPKNLIKALKMSDEMKPQVFFIFKSIKRLFKNVFCFFCFN